MRLGDLAPARALTRRTGAALLTLGLVLGASACSDDESADPGSSETPGPEVEAETATFQAPSGFEIQDEDSEDITLASGPGGDLISLVEIDFPGEAPELERQAEIALEGLGDKFEILEPVVVDDVEMWHLAGKEAKGGFADVYGAVVEGTAVRLTVRLGNDAYDVDQRAAANEELLGSWTWTA